MPLLYSNLILDLILKNNCYRVSCSQNKEAESRTHIHRETSWCVVTTS